MRKQGPGAQGVDCYAAPVSSHGEDGHVHGPNCNHDHDHDHAHKAQPVRKVVRPGRNEPCWCGSGTKYKKCHLRSDESASA
jgi:hypothetical protein